MKPKPNPYLRPCLVAAALAQAGIPNLHAANRYWDSNGDTAGAGATPAGTWGSDNFWNTFDGTGTGVFSTTVGTGNVALFSAGADAVNAYTVNVSGTQAAQGVGIEDGTATLSGGVIALDFVASSAGDSARIFNTAAVAGTATIDSGILVNTGTAGPLLKLTANNSAAAATDLLINGPITTTVGSTAYALRLGGAGNGRIATDLDAGAAVCNGLQQGNTTWSGTWTIAGNQEWTGATADIALSSSASFGAGAKLVMGDSAADVQKWRALTMNNPNAGVLIQSTATLSGGVTVNQNTLEIAAPLSAVAFTIGGGSSAGIVKLGADATFSGAVTTGTFSGSAILGNAASNSTLRLASGTLSTSVILGEAFAGGNENNFGIVKQTTGTLNLQSDAYYTGDTTVEAGRLNVDGLIESDISIAAGAAFGGEGLTTGTLGVASGATTLHFNAATQTAAFTAGGAVLPAGASVTVVPSGGMTTGQQYAVLSLDGGTFVPGDISKFIAGGRGSLSFTGGNTKLTYTAAAPANLKWTGTAGNPTFWDTFATQNWDKSGSADFFFASDAVTFDDSATTFNVVVQGASVSPGSTTFDNSANAYTLGGGSVAGSGAVTKNGSNTATVAAVLSNSGGVDVNAGTLDLGTATQVMTGSINTGSPIVTVADTSQLAAGMAVLGTAGIPTNATVSAVTSPTTFTLSANATATSSSVVLGIFVNRTHTFTGALTLDGGTLKITNLNQIGGAASTRPVQFGGGALEFGYTASASQVSDSLPLELVSGTSTVAVTGTFPNPFQSTTGQVTLRIGKTVTGSGNLVKTGQGVLALGKNSVGSLGNTFSGTVLVSGGSLDIRNPDSLGTTVAGTTVDNAILEIFPFGQNAGVSFNAEPLELSGASFFRVKNEDIDSDITNTWTGPVTVADNAVAGIASPKAVTISSVTPNTIVSTSANVSKLVISGPVTTGNGSVIKLGLLPAAYVLPVVQTSVAQAVDITGTIGGSGSVAAEGAAGSVFTLSLTGYSGDTTVTGGTLSLGTANGSNNLSSVHLATSGATLNLNFAGTDTVNKLFIGGVQQPAGVYEATGNPGGGIEIGQISGGGTLTVTSGPSASAFATWMAGFPSITAPNNDPGDDPDGDGASNLVEFGFDGNPASGANDGKIHAFTVDSDADGNADRELILTVAVRSAAGAFTGATSKSASGDGITYTIQGSTTLGSFADTVNVVPTAILPSPATLSPGYAWKSFSLQGSDGLPGKGFLRASVTAP